MYFFGLSKFYLVFYVSPYEASPPMKKGNVRDYFYLFCLVELGHDLVNTSNCFLPPG